jgi:4-amino-4-deoxy-L-arabinose transferase-like glycosyltransferase
MPLDPIGPLPVGAISGWLIAAGVILFGVLAIYAIYWIVFRMGK